MPHPHAARLDRLRQLMAAVGLDAMVVASLVNVRYLTGVASSNAALLVEHDGALLATDGRYLVQAAAQAPWLRQLEARDCLAALAAVAAGAGIVRLGFEAHHISVEEHGRLQAAAPSAHLLPAGHPVEELRTVKDPDEIELVRQACQISDYALAALLPQVRVGDTERATAVRLERLMIDAGAEDLAFATIVAAGPNSAVPHHTPTGRPIERGDLLKIDFGARVGGYHADLTRTFVVGGPPADWQQEIHGMVRQAQRTGRQALAPGAGLAHVDALARQVIVAAGQGPGFGHGLGHGVGLEIHEAPMMGPAATGTLEAGSPVTVEPGVYLPGRGGVRIEDTLVVRDGPAEPLTTSSRELLVLG
jgi:Xaa-Pro aminopeptidase